MERETQIIPKLDIQINKNSCNNTGDRGSENAKKNEKMKKRKNEKMKK